MEKKDRPDCIAHYSEACKGDISHYRGSDEKLSIGSPIGKKVGLTRIGVHHELLPPGRRTSWPHSESDEEEFAYVLSGNPQVWIDGHVYDLKPGDGVGFPAGTGINHTFMNNTESDVELLVVGEATKPANKVYYPLHPGRQEQVPEMWWHDVPTRAQGPHDGLPDKLREKLKG